MQLSAEQLRELASMADAWLNAGEAERTRLRAVSAANGADFDRAFGAMVAQLTSTDAPTVLPHIPGAMRDAALAASLERDSDTVASDLSGAAGAQADARVDDDATFTAFGRNLPAPERASGQRIGPYRLVKELGRGGMGVVWLAERADGQHSRQVALKMPLVENLNWLLAARFARERNILASLEHPGIARLYDAGVDQATQPYIAIEYVHGQPITDYVKEKRLKPEATAQLFIRVIEAVAHAHTQLVIHRDIKPSNILVDAKGAPHLLDFGIAKLLDDEATHTADATQLTRLSGRALTLDYASPEQVNNASLGTASDVYSLGVVLYELLAGRRPYNPKGPTRRDLEQAILDQDPVKPSDQRLTTGDSESGKSARRMRGDLDTIVLKALRKDPKQRYATAQAFADDLKRYLAYEPIAAKPDDAWYRVGRFVRRHRVGMVASAAVLAALAAGLVSTLWQAERAEAEARRANQESRLKDVEAIRATEAAVAATSAEQRARAQAEQALKQARRADEAAAAANAERGRADDAARSARADRARATAAATLANAAEQRAIDAAKSATLQRDLATEQRNVAQSQTRRANAMTEFMTSLFGANSVNQVDPKTARKATAVELLDRGAAQVSTALKDEPLALEAALTSLADMYGQLALPNKSQELFLKRWKSVEARNGSDVERIAASIALGASFIDIQEYSGALEQAAFVQSKLAAIPPGDLKMRAEAECLIGRALGTRSPPAAGIPHLTESVRLYRTLVSPDDARPNTDYVTCGMHLVGLLRQPDRLRDGLALADTLINYLQPHAQQVPAVLGGVYTVKGMALRGAMRHREAAEVTRRSVALYESTGNREDVLDQKQSLALAISPLGHYREALSLHAERLDYHDGIGNSMTEGIVLSRMLYAEALGNSGDAEKACQIGLSMFAQNKAKPVYPRLLNAYWHVPALECALAGRFDASEALQAERRASVVRLKQTEPVLLRYVEGMLRLAKGEYPVALTWLSVLNERDLIISGFPSIPSISGRVAFCRASLKAGNVFACERGMRQVEVLFAGQPELTELRPMYAEFLSVYGDYHATTGRGELGVGELRRALAIQEAVELPESHRLRRTREALQRWTLPR